MAIPTPRSTSWYTVVNRSAWAVILRRIPRCRKIQYAFAWDYLLLSSTKLSVLFLWAQIVFHFSMRGQMAITQTRPLALKKQILSHRQRELN